LLELVQSTCVAYKSQFLKDSYDALKRLQEAVIARLEASQSYKDIPAGKSQSVYYSLGAPTPRNSELIRRVTSYFHSKPPRFIKFPKI